MPRMLWPRLVESLRTAPVVRLGDYDYFVHPLTDGIPSVTAELLREAVEGLKDLLPQKFDRFLAPEAMGLPLATGLTLATGKSFVVARKRPYGLPGEIRAAYNTGYSNGAYYLNGLERGESLVLIDDVLSRGGTVRALAQAVTDAGSHLEKVVLLFNKSYDLDALSAELGVPVEALVRVRVENGAVQLGP